MNKIKLLSNITNSVFRSLTGQQQQPKQHLIQIRLLSQKDLNQSSTESDSTTSCNDDDLPDPTISNPYLKERPQCILCRYQIQIDYKNVRLLSQFVSPYTGRLYDKHITGLCEKQHKAVKKELARAVKFGLISMFYRDPKYNNDPKLFDPTRPQRKNPY